MENFNIYVVSNSNKFKQLCEKRLGKDITPENFIDMESFSNGNVHIVSNYVPTNYCIDFKPKYNILVNINNKWEEKNIISLTDMDIEYLLDENIIQDLKEFEKWKDQFAFKIINMKKFFELISNKIPNTEFVSLLSTRNRIKGRHLDTFNIFIKEKDNHFSIFYKDGRINFLKELPNSQLTKENILELINADVISECKCKFNCESNLLELDHNMFAIVPIKHLHGVSISKIDDAKFRALANIYDISCKSFSTSKPILAIGEKEDAAIKSLKEKLLNNLHKEIDYTIPYYEPLIKNEYNDI